MATVAEYFSILQINEGATIAQIKAAYRKRAKELHPDRNKSHTAHADFILLTEAYEYLSANPKARVTYTYTYQQTWQEQTGEQARERAESYANMHYTDFVQSEYYKKSEALEVVAHHLYLLFVIVFILGILGVFIYTMGGPGIIVSLLLAGFFVPLLLLQLARGPKINFNSFGQSLGVVARSQLFVKVVITALNLYVFLKIGMQTLIPLSLLCKLYLFIMLLSWGISQLIARRTGNINPRAVSFVLAPLALSLLLIFNFMFSCCPVKETYGFKLNRDGGRSSTLIDLERGAYNGYTGIRVFLDMEDLVGKNTITYTFENGLLGIRVMKDYELVYDDGAD